MHSMGSSVSSYSNGTHNRTRSSVFSVHCKQAGTVISVVFKSSGCEKAANNTVWAIDNAELDKGDRTSKGIVRKSIEHEALQ